MYVFLQKANDFLKDFVYFIAEHSTTHARWF